MDSARRRRRKPEHRGDEIPAGVLTVDSTGLDLVRRRVDELQGDRDQPLGGQVVAERAAVAGLALASFGIGILFITAFTASLGDAAAGEAGLRSAIVNTFHELGGAAGVAVLSTAAGTALVALQPVPADFHHAFTVGAATAAVGGLLALVVVPPVLRPSGAAQVGHGHGH